MAGKKLTKAEEQKVKLSAKNLFKKLTEEKQGLLVVDWYKDEQPRAKVKAAIESSLDHDLPSVYDESRAAAESLYRHGRPGLRLDSPGGVVEKKHRRQVRSSFRTY